MTSKFFLATLMIAVASFLVTDTADAKRHKDGVRNGKITAHKAKHNNKAYAHRAKKETYRDERRRKIVRQDRDRHWYGDRFQFNTKRFVKTFNDWRDRAYDRFNWRDDRVGRQHRYDRAPGWRRYWWGGYNRHKHDRHNGYYRQSNCVAVARTRGGYGRILHNIHGEAYGPRACRKAMKRCNRALDWRQSQGRNPYAACVIASRH